MANEWQRFPNAGAESAAGRRTRPFIRLVTHPGIDTGTAADVIFSEEFFGAAAGLQAARFDAASDTLTIPTAALPAASGAWTVAGWFRLAVDRNAISTLWSFDGLYASTWHELRTDSSGTALKFNASGSDILSLGSLTIDVWYFVAITKDASGNLKSYLGTEPGLPFSTTTGSTTNLANHDGDGYVMGNAYSEWADGRAWAVRVWDAQLSDAEVEAEFSASTAVRTSNLRAQWLLDAVPPTADSSGNGRTLANSGGTWGLEDGPTLPSAGGAVTGTASATLTATTGVASGACGAAGSAAATLGASVGAATGTALASGNAAATLATSVGAATGAHGAAGTASAGLTASTGSAAGTATPPTVTGTASATLTNSTGVASGSTVTGSASATLAASTGAANGTYNASTITGTASATLDASTGVASGSTVRGTASATLGTSVGAATGTHTQPVTGSASATLASSVGAATGARGASGSASAGLASSAGVATGSTVRGTASASLSNSVGVASGSYYVPVTGSASATLSNSIGDATGSTVVTVSGTAIATLNASLPGAWGFAMVQRYGRLDGSTSSLLGAAAGSVLVSGARGSEQQLRGSGSGMSTSSVGSGLES